MILQNLKISNEIYIGSGVPVHDDQININQINF